MYGKIKTSISVWGIVGGYWRSYQVLRIICIDDSLSQLYFTSSWNSSNILSSFGNRQFFLKTVWLSVAWHELDDKITQQCRIFPYKRVSFKKILLPWFNKKCSLNINFFMKYVKVRTFSEVIRKKHNLEVYANCVQCELTPH